MVLALAGGAWNNFGVQGSSVPDRELLDAGALCGHLVRPGSVHAFLAEHRGRLFPDEMFADLFPSRRGRPSVPADVIATVMVLQALEHLSDREAVDRLQTDTQLESRDRFGVDRRVVPLDSAGVVAQQAPRF
jgi:hypothetical protein